MAIQSPSFIIDPKTGNVSMTRGDGANLEMNFTILDEATNTRVPTNLTGLLRMTVREQYDPLDLVDADVVFKKEITITNSSTAIFTITSADSKKEVRSYFYDIQYTATGQDPQTILVAKFNITPEYTNQA